MSARSSLDFPNPFTQAPINVNAMGDTTLIAGVANKQIKVFRLKLLVGAAVTLLFKSLSTTLDGPLTFSANEGMILDFTSIDMPPWYTTALGQSLVLNCSVAVQVGGNMDYLLS